MQLDPNARQNEENEEDSDRSDYSERDDREEVQEGNQRGQEGLPWQEIDEELQFDWLGEYDRVPGPSADFPQNTSNQLLSNYHFEHRSIKWYKTLAISFLETSVANAYILYKIRNPFTAIKHLNFRENLILELISQRNLNHPREIERIIPNLHQLDKREQRNCVLCSQNENRKTTIFYCVECDKNMCSTGCFHKYHTLPNIYTRNKARNLDA
ncbi:MAG TPA: hypothetical protein PLS50_07180 [Candidatus Dojkabacteria bacterium]|nr:hypothetical protein [Candidatus Dojkabacteria bacterium]